MTLTASRPQSFSHLGPREEGGQFLAHGGQTLGMQNGMVRIKTPFPETDAFVAHVKTVRNPPNTLAPWIPLAHHNLPPSLRATQSARSPPSPSSSSSLSYTALETGSMTSRDLMAPNTPSSLPCSRGSRSRSSPRVLQRRRTLESYPMEHSSRDLHQRNLQQYQEQLQFVRGLQKTLAWSDSLRQYSRSRFDHALNLSLGGSAGDRTPSPCVPSSALTSRPFSRPISTPQAQGSVGSEINRGGTEPGMASSTPGTRDMLGRQMLYPGERRPPQSARIPQTPAPASSNGPTVMGSVLYNPKPMLLNSIRTRPKSEPPVTYRHIQVCPAAIRRQIEACNEEYRVIEAEDAESRGRPILVPYIPTPRTSQQPEVKEVVKVESEMSIPLDFQGDLEEEEEEEEEDEEGAVEPPPTIGVTPETPRDAATSPSPPKQTQSTPVQARQSTGSMLPSPGHSRTQCTKSGSRQGSAASVGSGRSSKRSSSDPKPCHWVDAISVSSVAPSPAPEEPEDGVTPDAPAADTTTAPEGGAAPATTEPSAQPPDALPKSQAKKTAEVDEAEEGDGPKLPKFLCPSSEQKSREAATLRWLRSTAFKRGIHTVPLM